MPLGPAVGTLGAPRISITSPAAQRTLVGVRRDVAAFFGVAPRGPARLPQRPLPADADVAIWLATAPRSRSIAVVVTSWDEYRQYFGGYEGPGRLPYAVSTFFTAGGRLAYVVRIVHEAAVSDPQGTASGVLDGLQTWAGEPVELLARNEGSWGNRLRATLAFGARPIAVRSFSPTELVVDSREWVPGGSLLRLTMTDDSRALEYVDASTEEPEPAGPGQRRVLRMSVPMPATLRSVEVVTASLEVIDGDPGFPRRELLDDIGLRFDHPRWLARVVVDESALVWPAVEWAGGTIRIDDPALAPISLAATTAGPGVATMSGGRDRWQDIVPDDFFDPRWVPGDELIGDGVQCLAENSDVGLLLAPDLYEPQPLVDTDDVTDPVTLCGPDFAPHVESDRLPPPPTTQPPPPGLDGLLLDPLVPGSLDVIIGAQRRLVDYAEFRRDLTVLLDVPPGLPQRRMLDWRNEFDSAFAACYHPWLDVATIDDQRDALVRINPSSFAAGIIAEREIRLGVQHGPANEIALGAVRVADDVSPERHDELHVNGINVFVPDRDGIRLTGARTLSRRIILRQLSVARLLTVLRLTLETEMRWAVFEPNNRALWAEVRRLIHDLLSRFYEAGAFRGATTKEAFFVRCDNTTMTTNDLDNGRMICLVGVAPVEPVEYVLIEVALGSDGLRVALAG